MLGSAAKRKTVWYPIALGWKKCPEVAANRGGESSRLSHPRVSKVALIHSKVCSGRKADFRCGNFQFPQSKKRSTIPKSRKPTFCPVRGRGTRLSELTQAPKSLVLVGLVVMESDDMLTCHIQFWPHKTKSRAPCSYRKEPLRKLQTIPFCLANHGFRKIQLKIKRFGYASRPLRS